MTTQALILLGHSHVAAVVDALKLRQPAAGNGMLYVHDVWAHNTQYADSDGAGGIAFNKDVLSLIERTVPADQPRQYITMFGGNGHVLLALSKHPRPFDFVLPERPDLPLDPTAEVVPYDYLAETLKPLMMSYIWQMIGLRQALGQSILCIETPPPYGDDAYVSQNLGSYIPDPKNIVGRAMRYKMWRLHSNLLKYFCDACGIEFLSAPEAGIDPEGFLRREGYGIDATHANAWYGELLLRKLEQRYAVSWKDWLHFA